jgi:glutathione S-transferase
MKRPVIYHIPVCPFSQRVKILLELKGMTGCVDFHVVDITRPRQQWLIDKNPGSTTLPILEREDGRVIAESMVILRYVEERYPDPAIFRPDPYEHAVEGMLVALEGPFGDAGYRLVMNQDRGRRSRLVADLLAIYRRMDHILGRHASGGDWLFERFGYAETVFTPLFMRFWFLDYYEDFHLPQEGFDHVRHWRDACLSYPGAQQVTREEIIKLYYDYAKGAGNGALLPGRSLSSFIFEPHWSERPWPPRDKYGHSATDAELGLAKS